MNIKLLAAALALATSSGAFAISLVNAPKTIDDSKGGKLAETFTELFELQLGGSGSNLTLTFAGLAFSGPMSGTSVLLDLRDKSGTSLATRTWTVGGSSVSFSGLVAGHGADYKLFASADRLATNRGDLAKWSGSVSMVPEPGTYALLFAGLGVVGFVAKRRRPQG